MYLLKHKDNHNVPDGFDILDCPGTFMNHFDQGMGDHNIYLIDLTKNDWLDTFIIRSMLKDIYNTNSDCVIYVIGELEPLHTFDPEPFKYPNVKFIDSFDDVPLVKEDKG